jgi:4-hydroxy-4-methyl-2-oxoglutarate aldolase
MCGERRHRDTSQLREIALPVFSTGASSFGPRRVPPAGVPMRTAWLDGVEVTADDHIVADDDGILVVGPEPRDVLFETARAIVATEKAQAARMRAGTSLRAQLDFAGYRESQHAPDVLASKAPRRTRWGNRGLTERCGALGP